MRDTRYDWDAVMSRIQGDDEGKFDWQSALNRVRAVEPIAAEDSVRLKVEAGNARPRFYRATDHAMSQIASFTGLPYPYFETVSKRDVSLAVRLINDALAHGERRDTDGVAADRVLRMRDDVCRAVVSTQYPTAIGNSQIAQSTKNALRGIDHSIVDFGVSARTGQMYLKVVFDASRVHDATAKRAPNDGLSVGDDLMTGVFVRNSEHGDLKLEAKPFVYRLVCTNGMTTTKLLQGGGRLVHTSMTPASVDLFLGRVVATAAANSAEVISQFAQTANILLMDVYSALDNVGDKLRLGVKDKARLVSAFERERAPTAFNVINAVTRFAQSAGSRRFALEEAAGNLLSVDAAGWGILQRAA